MEALTSGWKAASQVVSSFLSEARMAALVSSESGFFEGVDEGRAGGGAEGEGAGGDEEAEAGNGDASTFDEGSARSDDDGDGDEEEERADDGATLAGGGFGAVPPCLGTSGVESR